MKNCEFHGYAGPCPLCRAERIASDTDALVHGIAVIGVFPWTGRSDYRIEKALKTFKRRSAAERFAEKLNKDPLKISAEGYVARLVYK